MPRSSTNSQYMKTEGSEQHSIVKQMQKEADEYTRLYEWERRNLITLESTHEKLVQDIEAVKKNLANLEKETKEGEVKRGRVKIKNLTNETDIVSKKVNETHNETEKLKKTIDALRQEKTLFQNSLKGMIAQIQQYGSEIQRMHQNIEFGQNNSKTSQNIILDLKLRNDQDKSQYLRKIGDLNKSLRENRAGTSKSMLKSDRITTVSLDTSAILKKRLTKLIHANKQKVKLIENYQRNMKVINEAFQTIREATGISDLEEIQNTFIKGEEQSYGLLTYVDVLNQQLDNLVDSNAQLAQKIKQIETENLEREASRNSISTEEQHIIEMKEVISKKKEQITSFTTEFKEIEPGFRDILIKLSKSKFNVKWPNKHHEYLLGGVHLGESTIDNFMAELQEYANQVLFFKGKVTNQPNCEIFAKSLLFEQLQPKDFKKKLLQNTVAGPAQNASAINTNASTIEDPELGRELLTVDKFRELAVKDIDKQKNGVDKPKSKKNGF